ncbi:sulfatase-like hydrolase/transferase [Haladaptatus sp. NG-SE-30]
MSANDIPVTVLFTVDSLRADALPEDGVVATLGERGTRFENAFAHGNWTPFSFPSILGANHVFSDSRSIGVSEDPTLAESLREDGIGTAGFNGANGFLTEHWGYDRGFEEFETFTSGTGDSLYSKYLTAHPTVQAWLQVAASPIRQLFGQEGGARNVSRMLDVERRAIDFVEKAEPPFFLWVHYMDVHTPYVPAPKFVRDETGASVGSLRMLRAHARAGLGREVGESTLSELQTLYRAAIRQVDESVGRILSSLEDRGFRDDACVVLAGDHGEEFMEHGHLAHYPKLYEELIHVPLVVDHPDADGERVERAVGLDLIPPTICDAMGVEHDFAGQNLLQSDPDPVPVTSVAVRGDHVTQQPIPRRLNDGELLVSARTSDWSYIYHTESEERELYDRNRDPDEQENLWDDLAGSDVASFLHEAVEDRIEDIEADDDGESAEPPSAVTNQLKALGYQ